MKILIADAFSESHLSAFSRLGLDLDPREVTAPLVYQNHVICRSAVYEHYQRSLLTPALEAMSESERDARLLDADALNLLAADHTLQQVVPARQGRGACTLLTPHPTEAARLLGCDTALVQADRAGAALQLATRYQALVVLKGCGSIIATPAIADGSLFIRTRTRVLAIGAAGQAAASKSKGENRIQ